MTTRRGKRKQSEPDDDDNGREYPDKRRKKQLSTPSSKESREERREKITRRLYVNGAGITEENRPHLLEYLNSLMQRTKVCPPRERAIVDANIRVQFFASSILVFDCSTYADYALEFMDGMDFCGSKLAFERPHEYHEAPGVAHTEKRNARRLRVQGVYITAENRMNLIKYLTIVMRRRNLCRDDDCPIIDSDKSFLVFKSAEMATQALQLNGIDFSGSKLTIERPNAYAGPPDVVDQSAEDVEDDSLSSETNESSSSGQGEENTRRLYVRGVCITAENQRQLIKYLSVVMRRRNLCGEDVRPIMDTDKRFLVFESAEMATQALQLNGIDFCGSSLTIERPHAYAGPPDDMEDSCSSGTNEASSFRLEPSTSAISNNDDKIARRLYVKGMVIKKDKRSDFLQFLNQELRDRRLSAGIERPVVSIHDDFVVCASPETALHTLSLTGTRYNNYYLDLHRSNEMDCRLKITTTGIKVSLAFEYLNEQMRTRKLCGPSERPIVAGHNRYLIFSSAEMASRAYTLNGIDYDGSIITLERPGAFVVAPATVDTTTMLSVLSSYRQEGASCERLSECRLFVMGLMRQKESKGNFLQFLNEAMQEQKLCGANERPLLEEMQGTNRRFLDFFHPQQATGALALDGIEYKGCMLAFQRPAGYNGPPDHHRVNKVILQKQMARRLFVEGIQLEVNNITAYIEFLNETMVRKGLCGPNECSLVDCKWMTSLPVTRYLLFFRTPENATCALDLSGVDYNGSILTFARPDGYTAPANSVSMNVTDAAANLQEPALPGVPSKYGTYSADSFNSQLADMESSLEEMKNSKQKELENNQRLVEATKTQKIANFHRESLETVSKLWGEANAQIKVQETKFISANGEITQLKLKVEKLERQEHSRALVNEQLVHENDRHTQMNAQLEKAARVNEQLVHENGRYKQTNAQLEKVTLVNEQLVHENDRHKQTNAQLEKAAKTETTRSKELGSKLETANKRIQRMGEILANSMDELISERKNLRELKARMETSLQSEKVEREKAERQVEDLKAAAESRLPVSVSPAKHEQGNSQPAVKSEQEWDV
jgi:hypothetical protein